MGPYVAFVCIPAASPARLPQTFLGADLRSTEPFQRFAPGQRRCLLHALQREALLPAGIDPYHAARGEWSPELGLALQRYLARSPAKILLVAMEDVFEQLEQVNLPGTVDELPNWRRKLVRDLEDWAQIPTVRALIDALRAERPPSAPRAVAR